MERDTRTRRHEPGCCRAGAARLEPDPAAYTRLCRSALLDAQGAIPFVAPNPHQFAVAMGLAAPGVHLLDVVVSPVTFQQSFRLSRLGTYVVPRLFRLISADVDQRRELEFTKMRNLMQNAWEPRE